MSIYSGFPTRKDETKYNGLLSRLLTMLQSHLLDCLQGSIAPQKALSYTKVIAKMREYEEHKYLPPKFSELLDPLCRLLGMTVSTAEKVEPVIEEEERLAHILDRPKLSSHSMQKYRVKPKIGLEMESHDFKRGKQNSVMESHHLDHSIARRLPTQPST